MIAKTKKDSSRQRLLRFAAVAVFITACGYRPARFVDRPAVQSVHDDRPIPIPRRSAYLETVYLTDLYLRRPVVDALDPTRFPRARDVNALDEVPRSSWFSPMTLSESEFARKYSTDGPPRPPFTIKKEELTDSRGKTYELGADPDRAPATATAAAVIASRLLRASGYKTPEVWLVDLDGKRRSATRWPLGVTLGATDMTGPRSDDPNDWVSHRDRRTLRALGVFAGWIDLHSLGPKRVVDAYIGRPGKGHVEHFVIGLGSALGAGALWPSTPSHTPTESVRGNALVNLATLGLARPKPHEPTGRSLLVFSPRVDENFALSEPWEPIDRLGPEDGYWAAKRMLQIPNEIIALSVREARIPDPAVAAHVKIALSSRREIIARRWFRAVTPCELIGMEGRTIMLRDEAIHAQFELASTSRYDVAFLDSDGDEIAPRRVVSPEDSELAIRVPDRALDQPYVVVRVTARRGDRASPRAFEAHVTVDSNGAPRVIGIRH